MQCLVTGGAGFIGSNLAATLLSRGHPVRIMDTSKEPAVELGGDAVFHTCDICSREDVLSSVQGCDVVFHEAAMISVSESIRHPGTAHRINVEGTRNVLEACRKSGVKRVVLASSAAVYGNEPGLPKKETDLAKPASPYGESKLQNEKDALRYFEEHGLETVCLRYFNVYGPGQKPDSPYSGVISRFLHCAATGNRPTIHGDGKQTRDFVFVQDVVSANLLCMEKKEAAGRVFNIATGTEVSLLGLWEAVKKVSGASAEPVFAPEREGDIRRSVASIEMAREALGFEPAYSLEQGLEKTLAHMVGK